MNGLCQDSVIHMPFPLYQMRWALGVCGRHGLGGISSVQWGVGRRRFLLEAIDHLHFLH